LTALDDVPAARGTARGVAHIGRLLAKMRAEFFPASWLSPSRDLRRMSPAELPRDVEMAGFVEVF